MAMGALKATSAEPHCMLLGPACYCPYFLHSLQPHLDPCEGSLQAVLTVLWPLPV